MQIRTRLTLQFLLLGGIIMLVASMSIYFSSERLRKDDFYNRLRTKARITASALLDAVEHSKKNRAVAIDWNYPKDLHNERIIILDYLNDTIYTTDKYGDIKITFDVLEKVRLHQKVRYREGDFEILGTLYSTPMFRYVVIAAATDIEGFLHLKKLRLILVIVCVTSLILFAIAGWVFSGKALKPISGVLKRVEDISITSMHLRVPEGNGIDEIGRLARTFNNMLERLEKSFKTQKDFISNASHELRTPLTSINGQLEVLLMKDRSSEEYRNALQSVLDDIKSLIDLTNKLLLMARTVNDATKGYSAKIRIDELLWQIREETSRFKPYYHINISLDDSLTDAEQLLVKGDESLLKTAFSNIIDNACKYSSDQKVDINIGNTPDSILITFRDNGIGISPAEISKVFEPFYRASNSITYKGTGVGLTLVNQIITSHNGAINLISAENKGTIVSIKLPLSES
ncbi:MAG TPA: HAMP domain-containing sensor histidine kinase [Bacteroidales bacterium]|nr:HAMP domain-containing sensor histidine kinase [Bacteroidales bacterium]